ncbi:tetratricopeptide repeat protein [Kordiimonas lacus]|uniref:Flp pilus assembly protein TadD, contains TPR repeats n=1 Tax=Kordiimonas lacus TaxID=637679 RepID=A0A1G7CCQ0_9PROT|nr:tetratricopeptide repeat protein [Kordiimonas lacus]SDE37079.1 Flp pilus assembly protein TadD, contains TPR repeats [Kordiimonas lacus]
MLKQLSLVSLLMLAACGDNDAEQDIDYNAVTDAEIDAFVDAGDFPMVVKIIEAQDKADIADVHDYLVLAKVYNDVLDGVAAEVALEKAREAGADEAELVLPLARALVAQREMDRAWKVLVEGDIPPDDRFDALLLKADVARDRRGPDAAREYFQQAIKERPDHFGGYLGLATLAFSQGDLAEAGRLAEQAGEMAPDDPGVLHVRGAIARYEGRHEEAVGLLKQAVAARSGHLLARLELAGTYIDTRKFEDAQKELDAVYALSPGNSMAQYHSALILAMTGKPGEAEALLLRTGDLTRLYPPAARTYGHVAYQLGKYSTASMYLERFLEGQPSDRLTRLALAESISQRGRAQEALDVLRPLLDQEEGDLEAVLMAAAAHGALGEVAKVRDRLREARSLAAERGADGETLMKGLTRRLALARFFAGDQKGATEELQAYYLQNQDDVESMAVLANLWLGQGNYAAAEDLAHKIQARVPGSAQAANILGSVKYRQRDFEAALGHFDAALKENVDYQSAIKNRALVYIALSRFDDAEKDLVGLAASAPSDGQIHAMLGRVYLQQGETQKAMAELRQAEEILPSSAIVAADMSLALARQGYYSSAINKASKAQKLAEGTDAGLVTYLAGLVDGWQETIKAEADAEAEQEAERRAKLEKGRKKREAAKQKLIDDTRGDGAPAADDAAETAPKTEPETGDDPPKADGGA